MQPHSFSKRQLAAIALVLDEDKNASLSDKKKHMWVQSVSETKNQKANTGPHTKNLLTK
jgi:hypothetical protein